MTTFLRWFCIIFISYSTSFAQAPILKYLGYKANYCTDTIIPQINITATGGAVQPAVTTFAGGTAGSLNGQGTSAQFLYPSGVCVDVNNYVYVADQGNNRIRKITPNGLVSTFAGSTLGYKDSIGIFAKFYGPAALTADTNGDIYVSDYYNHKIRKITPSGVVTTFAGSTIGYVNDTGIKAKFNGPSGIVFDSLRNIMVIEQGNHKLRRITPDGVVSFVAGSVQGIANGIGSAAKFSEPFGITRGLNSSVYIADLTNQRIRRVTSAGSVTTVAGAFQGFLDASGTSAQFFLPSGITVDHRGNFYIADLYNHRIRKMTPSFVVTTVAGDGVTGMIDSIGEGAQFNGPAGITTTADGRIYVVDQLNHAIRMMVFYTITPPLPAGLTFNMTTASIYGTPTVVTPKTTYIVTGVNLFGMDTAAITFSTGQPSATTNPVHNFCNSATVSQLVATGTSLNWYDTIQGGTPLAGNINLINGKTYYVSQKLLGCESKIKATTLVSIVVPTTPTGSDSQVFCNKAKFLNLVANGSNIQWYDSASSGNVFNIDSPLVNGKSYYATQKIGACESIGRLKVKVKIIITPAPTGSTSQSFCVVTPLDSLKSIGTTIMWYDTITGGIPLLLGTNLIHGKTYYATQLLNTCESFNRLPVSVSVTIATPPIVNLVQSICNLGTIQDLTPNGSGILWYDTMQGGTPLNSNINLLHGKLYFSSQVINSCESINRATIIVSINITPTPTGIDSQMFCNKAKISNLLATGSNIQWYDSLIGGSVFNVDSPVISGKTYYATQKISGCESIGRLAVKAKVNVTNAPTGALSQNFCNNAILASVTVNGTGIKWYDTITGGVPLPMITNTMNGKNYYASQTLNSCESINRLPVLVSVTIVGPPSGLAVQEFCNKGLVQELTPNGTGIFWYDVPSGGIALNSITNLSNGISYYAEQVINTCNSNSRLEVKAVFNITSAPAGNTIQQFCNDAKISELNVTGSQIEWFISNTSNVVLSQNMNIISGTIYYASQTINGCPSKNRLPVTAIIAKAPAPIGAGQQSFCNKASLSDLVVIGENILWYDTIKGGAPLSLSTSLVNQKKYYASKNPLGCESNLRLVVNAIIVKPDTTIIPIYNGLTVGKNGTLYQWKDCDSNMSIIKGANEKSFYPTKSGSYAIEVTHLGCTGQSSCRYFEKLKSTIQNISAIKQIQLLPNPTNGLYKIILDKIYPEITLEIYNLEGKRVERKIYSNTKEIQGEIDVATGIYLVKLFDKVGEVISIKVLKE